MSSRQISSTYFWDKVMLRLNHLPAKDNIKVLDCCAGEGKLWAAIQLLCKKNIEVLSLDNRDIKGRVYIKGNNLKVLGSMDLSIYDVIDIDVYGSPYPQLRKIFDKKDLRTVIFITFIQTFVGVLHFGMLEELGYTRAMVRKCPTLFYRNGVEKLKAYLALHGVEKLWFKAEGHYFYGCFTI